MTAVAVMHSVLRVSGTSEELFSPLVQSEDRVWTGEDESNLAVVWTISENIETGGVSGSLTLVISLFDTITTEFAANQGQSSGGGGTAPFM